jgi:hypothetical protein
MHITECMRMTPNVEFYWDLEDEEAYEMFLNLTPNCAFKLDGAEIRVTGGGQIQKKRDTFFLSGES